MGLETILKGNMKNIRIIVNDIVAVPGSGGIFSILTDFYDEVKYYNRAHKNIEWIFLLAGNYLKETDQIKIISKPDIKASWLKRLKFEVISGNKMINSLEPDIYISLQNTMTLGVNAAEKWTYVHQALPYTKIRFSIFDKKERKMWVYKNIVGRVINYTLKHSNTKVIVQTSWMKNELLKRGVVKKDKIVVFPPQNIKIDKQMIASVPENNKFFFPATGMPYKNHKTLFKAVRMLEDKGLSFEVLCTLSQGDIASLKLKVPHSVKLVGILSREEVLKKYGTYILVFPSLLETFGLPLLEAKLTNDFIIAGDTKFGKEVLSGYANVLFFNPHSANDLMNRMESCIKSKTIVLNDSLKGKSFHRSLLDLIVNRAYGFK